MKKILFPAIALCFTISFSGAARASIWTETGDARDLPGTAQIINNAGPLTQIVGNLAGTYVEDNIFDVDMFRINIFNPVKFSALTVEGVTLVNDPQLFLFDWTGRGIYMNDDGTGLGSQSWLPAGGPLGPLTPGLYYLAIGWFDNEPFSELNGRIFEDLIGVAGPDLVAGGLDPVYSWNSDVTGRIDLPTGYQILLTGAGQVPEPGTFFLFGGGIISLFGYKLRRRKSAVPMA